MLVDPKPHSHMAPNKCILHTFFFIFLLELISRFTNGTEESLSSNQTSPWSCYLTSERRLECRNLYNFYFSSYSLCRDDYRLLVYQKIDEINIFNDYNCRDHGYSCYFKFDSTWSICLNSLRKLTIENLSFIVRLHNTRKLLPIDYLKIVNTHGSVTELLHLFEFSNQSSIFIQNLLPRWSGMDLLSVYYQYQSVQPKQLWINVADWYPIVYMRIDQQIAVRHWLHQIPCLHIELGDCQAYHHDMVFLRDSFAYRPELSNELYCYTNQGTERFHWSKIPALYHNYIIPEQGPTNVLQSTELRETCFNRFTHVRYSINSNTDLQEFYSYFRTFESYSIPLWTIFPYATLSNLPVTSTTPKSTIFVANRTSNTSRIDYINIYDYAFAFNETRWLSSVEAYPDGRFLIIDNGNQQLLLLNENGSYRVDLTSILFRQIQLSTQDLSSGPTIHNSYSLSHLHIDQDGYIYLVPTLAYYIYIFAQDNRLVRCLTPRLLSISIIRSDCFATTHTGLIYICDDTYRVVRVYSRMGIPHKTISLDYLPLKLSISNSRIFTYSLEYTGVIHIYTLAGIPVRKVTMCAHNAPSEVIWFRGKYFLTCGTYLYVLNEQGEQIAEHNLNTLLDYSDLSSTIHDFALNKNGLFIVTFRRNGALFNRYWIIRPKTF